MNSNQQYVFVSEDDHNHRPSKCNVDSVSTTPSKITPTIKEWAASELHAQNLIHLEVAPKLWCQPLMCHGNVDIALQLFGGALALGWTIFDTKGLWLSAELHSVWEYDGQLYDITPDNDPKIKQRLFADTGRRIEHGGEDWLNLIDELTQISIIGAGGKDKLLSTSPTVGLILKDMRRMDRQLTAERNQHIKQGVMFPKFKMERYWRQKDRFIARLMDWLEKHNKPQRKQCRARKKDERRRRKAGRRCS